MREVPLSVSEYEFVIKSLAENLVNIFCFYPCFISYNGSYPKITLLGTRNYACFYA